MSAPLIMCPECSHSMLLHDGDGIEEHFSCCVDDCTCKWEYAQVYDPILDRVGIEPGRRVVLMSPVYLGSAQTSDPPAPAPSARSRA